MKPGGSRAKSIRVAAIVSSILLAGAVHILARSPRPRTAAGDDLRGGVYVFSLIALGVAVLVFILSRASVVRKRTWFSHAALVGWCGLFIGIGVISGLNMRWGDHDLNYSRADELRKALIAYRSKEGKFPPNLDSLVPGYVAELPKSRAGVFTSDFEYQLGTGEEGPDEFVLRFADSLGVTVLEPESAYLTVPRD